MKTLETRTDIFAAEITGVLKNNILDFWLRNMQDPSGGFYGRITGKGVTDRNAPKGAVLNARILWAFSAAYRMFRNPEYIETARRAKDYIEKHFTDPEYGGVYWSLTGDGEVLDGKKQFYALSFTIYGLSEYYMATGDQDALSSAIRLYETIENHSLDTVKGGYIEALARDWKETDDIRLSAKDANEKKTMNTHLHVLEAYSALYKAWSDARLKKSIENLIDIFIEHIFDTETGHLGLFFDEDWNRKDGGISYGHDIEASWLLLEAAFSTNDIDIINRTAPVARRIGLAGLEGIQKDGSMIYEKHENGSLDTDRHWWVQAETLVGALWMWRYNALPQGADIAMKCWDYIKKHIIDHDGGEWFWSCRQDGTPNVSDDKAGLWKCPYHNTRMCIETLKLFSVR